MNEDETQYIPHIIQTATKSIVENSQRLGLTWNIRLGTVTTTTNDQTHQITGTYDGDSAALGMVNITGRVLVAGDRVWILEVPPAGNFIIGTALIGNVGCEMSATQENTGEGPHLLVWDTLIVANGNMNTPTDTSSITIPFSGVWAVSLEVELTNIGGRQLCTIMRNTEILARGDLVPTEDIGSCATTLYLYRNDVITCNVFKDGGGDPWDSDAKVRVWAL